MGQSNPKWQSNLFNAVGSSAIFLSSSVNVVSQKTPINYSAGIPDPNIVPYRQFRSALEKVFDGDNSTIFPSFSYADPHGIEELRNLVALRRHTDARNVIITNGAMEAIYLSALATINSGDKVIVEDATFPQSVKIFNRVGAEVIGAPLTHQGIDLNFVRDHLKHDHTIKAIYIIPDFQNPTGISASTEVKSDLLNLAAEYGVAVIADNPYSDLWFHQAPAQFPQAFRGGANSSPLFEIGSFSKWLGPGLRAGWVITSADIAEKLASYRLGVDGGYSSLIQYALVNYLTDSAEVQRTLREQRSFYQQKAAALSQALRQQLGDDVTFNEPQGGYFLWAQFPEWFRVDDIAVQRALAEQHIDPVRGDSFFVTPGESHTRYARFAFSHTSADQLVQGAERLKEALSAVSNKN